MLQTTAQTARRMFWIQRADFLSEEFDPVDLGSAKSILRNHNWLDELGREHVLQAKGEDWCMPGIGFVEGDNDHILHICPRDTETAHCFYLIGNDPGEEAEGVSTFLQYRLLQLFYQSDHEGVKRILREAN